MWNTLFPRKQIKTGTTVHWAFDHQRHGVPTVSGLALLSFPPEPALTHYYGKNSSQFMKCPAFKSALQNTYVIKSPIDVEIVYDRREPTRKVMNVIVPEKATPALREYLIHPRFRESQGENAHEAFTLQTTPYLFWSDGDVAMEMIQPYLEWDNPNGVRVISGHYNIGKWSRHIEYAVELQQPTGTFKLRRGDVMFYVRFSTADPHTRLTLKESPITPEKRQEILENTQLKFSQSKCPLKALYDLRAAFDQRQRQG